MYSCEQKFSLSNGKCWGIRPDSNSHSCRLDHWLWRPPSLERGHTCFKETRQTLRERWDWVFCASSGNDPTDASVRLDIVFKRSFEIWLDWRPILTFCHVQQMWPSDLRACTERLEETDSQVSFPSASAPRERKSQSCQQSLRRDIVRRKRPTNILTIFNELRNVGSDVCRSRRAIQKRKKNCTKSLSRSRPCPAQKAEMCGRNFPRVDMQQNAKLFEAPKILVSQPDCPQVCRMNSSDTDFGRESSRGAREDAISEFSHWVILSQ